MSTHCAALCFACLLTRIGRLGPPDQVSSRTTAVGCAYHLLPMSRVRVGSSMLVVPGVAFLASSGERTDYVPLPVLDRGCCGADRCRAGGRSCGPGHRRCERLGDRKSTRLNSSHSQISYAV